MNASLVRIDYQGMPVNFNEDGWFNATVAAAHYGKEVYEWLRLPETRRYLDALSRRHGINR
ncbi:MAG: KilA-N domain-containing protein, partial [Candidatus Competibacteraceae bacterium]|nr:KilA-N domain-containing protein [Candidatus Competibacteraceae bacterium]